MAVATVVSVLLGAGAGFAVVDGGPDGPMGFVWSALGSDAQRSQGASSLPEGSQASPAGTPGASASVPADPDPSATEAPASETDAAPTEPSAGPEPVTTPGPPPAAGPGAQLVAEIAAATNAQRVAHGLPALAALPCATQQVDSRVARLVAENAFYHPELAPVIDACGVQAVGENLALGYTSGAGVVDGWMNSDGHRANLLGEWTHQGVSCQLQNGRWLCGTVYTRAR